MLTGTCVALTANAAAGAANAAGATTSTTSTNNAAGAAAGTASTTNAAAAATTTAATTINIEVVISRRVDVAGPVAVAAANAPLPPPTGRRRLGALQTEAPVISRRLTCERYVQRLAAYPSIEP